MPLKTYSHLMSQNRMPNDYELVSTKLLYYLERGFEVDLPTGDWYRRYQKDSPFECRDWERFRDPRETTYTRYVNLQRSKELFVDGLLEYVEETDYDERLSPAWLTTLATAFAPFRFPGHGLMMAAAYVGQMAPGGRIAIVAAFQAGDEMRRVQRIAYRTRQLELAHPGFADDSRALWQSAPEWQPLRETIERLLCAYDWGEAFVALNLVVKPLVDDWFTVRLGESAQREGDYVLRELCFSLGEDSRWHREWSRALVDLAIADRPSNRALIATWTEKWRPLAESAVSALAAAVERGRTVRSPSRARSG